MQYIKCFFVGMIVLIDYNGHKESCDRLVVFTHQDLVRTRERFNLISTSKVP